MRSLRRGRTAKKTEQQKETLITTIKTNTSCEYFLVTLSISFKRHLGEMRRRRKRRKSMSRSLSLSDDDVRHVVHLHQLQVLFGRMKQETWISNDSGLRVPELTRDSSQLIQTQQVFLLYGSNPLFHWRDAAAPRRPAVPTGSGPWRWAGWRRKRRSGRSEKHVADSPAPPPVAVPTCAAASWWFD